MITHLAKLKEGESLISQGNNVIEICGTGKHAYLWIGGHAHGCYATLSGQKTLQKLAKNILKLTK